MLIQLRVENHRSLRDEQTLSLVAAHLGTGNDERLIRPPALDEALLPAVALYGANASGKTNVLLAFRFMANAVLSSHRLWEPESGIELEPFALAKRGNDTSVYEVDMLVGGVRHRYGFALSTARVEEEWLYAWPRRRRQILFERERDHFNFGRNLSGENETIRGLTRPNSLFLSAAAQNNHPTLLPIFTWFRRLRFEIERTLGDFGWPLWRALNEAVTLEDRLEREDILRLLRTADTGIVDLRVEAEELPDHHGHRVIRHPTVYFQHRTEQPEECWLPLEAQSAGTIRLLERAFHLLPLLRTGGVLCIDELESSLHPMLCAHLVSLFGDKRRNPKGAQLIFTTHDTNLLGSVTGDPQLRRDQIWFTEKDPTGATQLYPLTDYHPRKEENLERGYLQGRYGAVPFLGNLTPPDDDA